MNSGSELYLILSNIAILPAIFYAWTRRLYPEAGLLTSVGINSFLYHSCQGNFFCIVRDTCIGETKYTTLQNSDEFHVNITIIWFIMFFLSIPRNVAIGVVFLISPIFLISISTQGPNLLFILIGTIAISGVFTAIYSFLLYRKLKFSYVSAILAFILLVSGFTIFYIGGDPNQLSNYNVYHSTWHILLMTAVFFVLDIRYGSRYVVIDGDGIRVYNKKYYKFYVDD